MNLSNIKLKKNSTKVVFDIYDKKNDEAANFIKDLAHPKSHFGDTLMEGVVIKSYNKQLFGKYINEEFRIEIHWRKKQIELNQLATLKR